MEKNVKIIHEKTVIIGAGMSGIAAAVNLLSNNYDKFVIYESLEVGL
jgi:cation diffusion facilitator CzcD-associated flavoprotein CzcO